MPCEETNPSQLTTTIAITICAPAPPDEWQRISQQRLIVRCLHLFGAQPYTGFSFGVYGCPNHNPFPTLGRLHGVLGTEPVCTLSPPHSNTQARTETKHFFVRKNDVVEALRQVLRCILQPVYDPCILLITGNHINLASMCLHVNRGFLLARQYAIPDLLSSL